MVEAFCDGESPRYLVRDRDSIYGSTFRDRVKAFDIEEVVIARFVEPTISYPGFLQMPA
jgi:hypothetical protein